MTEDQIKHMVDLFLGWKLPDNFNPDNGISFAPIAGEGGPHPFKREPSGTNLFDATQATAMVRHMIEGLPRSSAANGGASEVLTEIVDFFATMQEGLGDMWAHPDDFSSYGLDYCHRDGTKLWIELVKNGTIHLMWKRGEVMKSMNFGLIPTEPQEARETRRPPSARPGWWTWDEGSAERGVGNLYYFAPANATPPPYKTQRHVTAIIDIASDGTLAGVELIEDMPAPSSSSLTRPKLCSHAAIISLDGKWHCQKCGDVIEMPTAYSHPSHQLGTENG